MELNNKETIRNKDNDKLNKNVINEMIIIYKIKIKLKYLEKFL